MNLLRSYPEKAHPPELREAVRSHRLYERLVFPWSCWWVPLVNWFCRRNDKKNPPWDEAHFADWSRDELLWRVLFLQGAGRWAWVERETWRLLVAPVAVVVAFAVGLALGR